MKASATSRVNASPEQVWALLAHHEGMSDWGPGITVSVDEHGTEPNGVGTVRRINLPGPVPDLVEEITAFEPGLRLGYKGVAGVPLRNYRGTVALAPEAGGTRITWTLQADNKLPGVALKPVALGLLSQLVRQAKKL